MRAFLPKCLKKFQKHQKLNKDAYLKQMSGRNARKQRLYMLTVKQETHRPWQNERSGKERTQQGKPWRKTKSSEANAVWLQTKDLANYPPNHCHTKSKGILQKPGSGVVSFGRKEINCRGKVEDGGGSTVSWQVGHSPLYSSSCCCQLHSEEKGKVANKRLLSIGHWVLWCTRATPALQRWGQEDGELKASQGICSEPWPVPALATVTASDRQRWNSSEKQS